MRHRIELLSFAVSLGICVAGCGSGETGNAPQALKVTDLRVGGGELATPGAKVYVHYTGWVYKGGRRGKQFDTSLRGGAPFAFDLGKGEVIQGWDDGIKGMRVGGKRQLIIPPELGYGKAGAPPDIPPDSTLEFEVELVKIGP